MQPHSCHNTADTGHFTFSVLPQISFVDCIALQLPWLFLNSYEYIYANYAYVAVELIFIATPDVHHLIFFSIVPASFCRLHCPLFIVVLFFK
jgi:hypothetical protein